MRRALRPLIAILGVAGWLWLSPPAANDLVGGDEGYYGTMARNIVLDPPQALGPSLSPLGPPGDKPPLYPAMIAPFVAALGPTPQAVRAPSYLFALVILLAAGALAARAAGPGWGVFAIALLVTLPWFADASRVAAAELPLAALGALALVVLASSPGSRPRAAIAGALLGLAFLCKLWLVAPVALAATAMVWPAREERGVSPLAWLVGTAMAVASLHLAAVALLSPGDFEHWSYIYLGRSLAERVSGEGYADYWHKPFGTYWSMLTRAFALVLPLVAVGAEAAWRRRDQPVRRALLAWAAGVLLLSLFRVKSGGYAYVVVPAWAALAALGAEAMTSVSKPSWRTMALGAVATLPWLARWGASDLPLGVWAATWLAGAAVLALVRSRPAWSRPAVSLLACIALAIGAARTVQRLPQRYHVPGYREVAATLAPHLADAAPARASFVSPEAPTMAFHLFRTGQYWGTPVTPWSPERLASVQADTALRAFVVDTTAGFYGGWPDSETVAWLERETDELTAQVNARAGRRLPLRVFLRR